MKRGQIDTPIILFVAIVIGLIVMAPILLKVFNEINNAVGPALGNVTNGGATAQTNFNAVMNPLINWWDKILTIVFFIDIVLLLLSAFLIDTHPFWVILYVFMAFMLILFIPDMLQVPNTIYDSAAYATEVAQLGFMDALRQNFVMIVLGIIILTGIIIYGKINLFPRQGDGLSGGGRV